MIAVTEVSCVKGAEAPLGGVKEAQVWTAALLFTEAVISILTPGWARERAPSVSAEINFLTASQFIFKILMCGYWELNPTLDYQIAQGVQWSKNSEISVGGLGKWRPWTKLIS